MLCMFGIHCIHQKISLEYYKKKASFFFITSSATDLKDRNSIEDVRWVLF